MRLRLVHQLSLLLVGTSLLAVVGLAALTATHLRSGFTDYLRTQDRARLATFAEGARQAVERHGVQGLAAHPEALMAPLLGGPPPRPDAFGEAPPPRGERPYRPLRADERALRGFFVTAPDGSLLWGRPPPRPREVLDHPIVLDGRTVAVAHFAPRREASEDEADARFLQRQFAGLAGLGLAMAVLAAGVAVWVARRWMRPLAAAQAATHRLAQGDFEHRLPPAEGRWRDELDDLALDLNRLAEGLQRLEGSRRRWVAELSHELRTPLTVMRGELDAVADGVRPLNAERLDSLRREVGRLTRLADDFALLARGDLRALPVHRQPTDPAALLADTRARWAPRLDAAGLANDWQWPDLPGSVSADATRLQQVLDNLLGNALAYTQAPGRVAVQAQRHGPQGWRVTVDDSPPGVPDAAERERLFEPLYRRDASRSRAGAADDGGSGLGLSIARALVQAHGGRLHAEASPLGGLRLVMELPL
ncbi:ATP-binding protein [Inhella crocodyli]|uniref:histidine kinase n=1 Tax=Inhella crocodyli TaxID=2499851 RepID=A0A3S2XSY8_9BURK|nr:ATP-binding protein [Inhella crocodyli]RVT86105.1 HAMP domain-containing protein [Inhella crocodyli]